MTPPILWRLKELGYVVHEDGQPNVVVCRSNNSQAGAFDDVIHVARLVEDEWLDIVWQCTADPGRPWLLAPMNSKGTARVKPGQWSFKIGRRSPSKGGYRCLVPAAPITVTRDLDLDDQLDDGAEDHGFFGIQVHRANREGTSTVVGKWSAGCIVVPISEDAFQEEFMDFIAAGLEDLEQDVLVTVLQEA